MNAARTSSFRVSMSLYDIGALINRIGFWGLWYDDRNQEPKIVLGNY